MGPDAPCLAWVHLTSEPVRWAVSASLPHEIHRSCRQTNNCAETTFNEAAKSKLLITSPRPEQAGATTESGVEKLV